MIKKALILLFFSGCFIVNAQDEAEETLGAWYMYTGTNRVSERLSIHTEAQIRYYGTTDNFNQLILRTGLNYHINPNTMATIGYGFIDTDPFFGEVPGEENFKENRIFEQFVMKSSLWEFHIEHRYRLEHRFFDYGEDTETQHRVRYRLQLTLPLTDIFFINLYDELMVNLQDDLFGQNRIYAALGINITHNSNLQLGYLRNQFTNGVYDRLQVALTYNPDLRGLFQKKKS